ncbi:subtilisin-like protein [Gonapodya prolifera JEL478]|uniref:Subtilisin-like protein n=1 Tax=Gonapodya prolifera (strain JEL478) TaxID=1344416 RepID=A0A139A2R1_GONPJ|nr:subtilisin-like protein [Gonapodya prolifera JEL478]|eukprot:KXS11076.1 subtilisin-like protein [Gonapodya prolifera JEL478]
MVSLDDVVEGHGLDIVSNEEEDSPLQENALHQQRNFKRSLDASGRSVEELEGLEHTFTDQPSAPWNLIRLSQRTIPLGTSYAYGARAGVGVDVYIVDTGVFADHSEFGGRAKVGVNFVTTEDFWDGNGHGTHVAGTVAGATYGVAKRASIVAVKVLDKNGSGSWSDIIAGIAWVAQQARNSTRRSVANLSITGSYMQSVNDAIASCVRTSGVHFAAAAGNAGLDGCQYSPGSASNMGAVSVGSVNSKDTVSSFSNIGSCLTIFAPGESIISASPASTVATRIMSGTSMASPHVAGVMALALSYRGNLSWWGMRSILVRVATKGGLVGVPAGSPNIMLFGYWAKAGVVG